MRRLELFGSAASGQEFDPNRSDFNFLVAFEPTESNDGLSDRYFGLWDELKVMFERDIHLVTTRSMRNPYFIESVNTARQTVYAL